MRHQPPSSEPGTRRSMLMTLIGMLIFVALGGWIYVKHELTPIDLTDRRTVQVEFKPGAGLVQIGQTLASHGLIRSARLFALAVRLEHKESELQAGTYALSRSMSADQMIEKIAAGDTDTVTVSVPEGFTAAQIADRIAGKNLCSRLEFLKVVATQGDSFSFADGFSPPRSLEGYLYPLTYSLLRSSSPHALAGQMLSGFDQNVFSKYPEVHDWHPIIIVASLIEREALVDSDRPLIASVFYNRMRINMPLQCDATVQYALPEHKPRLMFSDLRVNSPYNTYLHRGLPPGPICNPGLKSIDAAIHPASTDYLFYVAGPDGRHIFSRTLAEQDREIAALRHAT